MKKIIFSLFILGSILLSGEKSFAHHQDSFPGIEIYENISVFRGRGVVLSWIAEERVPADKLLLSAENSSLTPIAQQNDLGIMIFDDNRGNTLILIEGAGETLLLSYTTGKIKRPYNLLEFKVEDEILSRAQIRYIVQLIENQQTYQEQNKFMNQEADYALHVL